ncbi:breast cancer type 2 susceptibility protein isoform X3 [Brienomyrus brachyistius]|uniref:breast cancer type 2 susceptibility protein isoform X3 n=1 Tax=Brienomyrus brachyistius TaxID=42636 RepID=UPI0020B27D5A|nr:breast cancer type 2 susceptibility protein isoform X3 [Brienomyrus brachyistius]
MCKMLEVLNHHAREELGALCPDWFEVLTVKASTRVGDGYSGQKPRNPRSPSEKEAPLEKPSACSQMFSTPKIFRGQERMSPKPITQDEALHCSEKGADGGPENLYWVDTSPCLFGSTNARSDVRNQHRSQPSKGFLEFLDTPGSSVPKSVKRISESLGAQIDPDLSWTSSLNTPVMSPTVILTKPDSSACPETCTGDKREFFVRKLFPSLSEASGIPNSLDKTKQLLLSEDVACLDKKDGVGAFPPDVTVKQKLPDAIQDREVRSTVAHVLDGNEDIISFFFSNSCSSSLRKVKPGEGVTRKEGNSVRKGLATSVLNAASTDTTPELRMQPIKKPGDESQLMVDCSVPWTPMTLPDSISQPLPKEDTNVHTDISVKQFVGSILPKGPPACSDAMESYSPVQCDSQWKSIVKSQGNDREQCPSPSKTETRGAERGRMGHLTTDELLPSVQLPNVNMSCNPTGDFTRDVAIEKPSQHNVEGLKEAESLAEDSLKSCSPAMPIQKPSRKFVYSLLTPSPSSHIVQSSKTYEQSDCKLPTLSESSEVQRKYHCVVSCSDGAECAGARDMLDLKHRVFEKHDGTAAENAVLKVSCQENDHQACAAFTEELKRDVHHDRDCSSETALQTDAQNGCMDTSSFPTQGQIDRYLPETSNEPEPNGTIELTADQLNASAKSGLSQFCTVPNEPVLATKQIMDYSDCVSNAVNELSSQRQDSSYHTTLSDVSHVPRLLDDIISPGKGRLEVGFRTASEKIIALPFEAVQRAKALLNEAADCNLTGKTTAQKKMLVNLMSQSTMRVKESSIESNCQSLQDITIYPGNVKVEVGQLYRSNAQRAINVHTNSSRQSSIPKITGFKTASNSAIHVSSTNLKKARELLDETDYGKHPEKCSTKGQGMTEEEGCKPKPSAAPVAAVLSPVHSSAQVSLEAHCFLTASQKADVSELCSLLEEADSQFEFTQFKQIKKDSSKTGVALPGSPSDEEVDPDFLTGIDFNDSFTSLGQVTRRQSAITEVTVLDEPTENSDLKHNGQKVSATDEAEAISSSGLNNTIDKGTEKSLHPKDIDRLLVPGVLANSRNCGGFYSAQGVKITVPMERLKKPSGVFDGLDVFCTSALNSGENLGLSAEKPRALQTDIVKSAKQDTLRKVYYCSYEQHEPCKEKMKEFSKKDLASSAVETAKCIGIDFNEMKETRNVTGITPHFVGFKTAGGNAVSVSERALSRATAIFADLEEVKANTNEVGHQLSIENPEWKNTPIKIQDSHCGDFTLNVTDKLQVGLNELEGKMSSSSKDAINIDHGLAYVSKKTNVIINNIADKLAAVDACQTSIKAQSNCENIAKSNLLDDELKYVEDIHFPKVHQNVDTKFKCPFLKTPQHENSVAGCRLILSCDLQGKGRGFTTASGKMVSITDAALQQAKAIFKDCIDSPVCVATGAVQCETSPKKMNTFKRRKESLSAKEVPMSPQSPEEKAYLKDKNSSMVNEAGIEMQRVSVISYPAPETSHCGFSTASGKRVCVSETALLKAKTFLESDEECLNPKEHVATQHKGVSSPNIPLKRSCGFSTASGKSVSVSTKSLQEAKVLFSEMESVSLWESGAEAVEESKRNEFGIYPSDSGKSNCGFSTASGKKVSVSEESLMRAKTLLDQCDEKMEQEKCCETESLIESLSAKQTTDSNIRASLSTKTVDDGIFSTCQETSLCSGNQAKKNVNVGASYSDSGTQQSSLTNCDDGLVVVSAKKNGVTVNEKSSICAQYSNDVPCGDRTITSVSPVSYNCSTAVPEKHDEIELSKDIPLEVLGTEQTGTPKIHQNCLPSSGTTVDDFSPLNLQSLGLGYCTETQQQYFEQEAMTCTKALLQDEAENRRISEKVSKESSCGPRTASKFNDGHHSEEQKLRNGKRLRAMDSALEGQPPLKRQLLEEFDRTSIDGTCSFLVPLKSSPDGTLKDRRTFRYSMPLQPNVTRPFGDKTLLEQRPRKDSSLLNSSSGNPRDAAFVPPFRKPPETKGAVSQGPSRHLSVFIPPFKNGKLRMNGSLQESVTQVQNGRKSPGSVAEPSKYIPPAKRRSEPIPLTKTRSDSVCGRKANTNNDTVAKCEERGLEQGIPSACPTSPYGNTAQVSVDAGLQGLESLQHTRDLQDMRIMKKKRQTIRPQPGSLLLAKTSGKMRLSLRGAFGGSCPVRHTQEELYKYGVPQGVSQISSESAESFRFRYVDYFSQETLIEEGGVQLADGGWLIPDNRGTVGKEEFYRALCDTPGVDPKLISESWVYNHYRWVVWKLACMERSFPRVMGSLCLTPQQVLLQLKYRYDLEIDQSRRSALRKIMERDDTPAKTMVLCICGIVSTGSDRTERKTTQGADSKVDSTTGLIWVTDGWYCIKAVLDIPLTAMVQKGRLTVGVKVVTHGAELVGSQDACTPLEAPSNLMLKISANSTRVARWDTKLGYHHDPRPLKLRLSSLYSNGGPVGCVEIIVLRSYPTQWMEKKADGAYVFRSGRAEEREVQRHSASKQKTMESLFAKIQAQFEKDQAVRNKCKSKGKRLSRQEIEALQDGEDLHEVVDNDPTGVEALLSEKQLEILSSYRQCLEQKKRDELQERFRQALEETQKGQGSFSDREVTPVWRLRVADCRETPDGSGCLLNIWRPSSELQTLLKEGSRYKVYQLATSEGRKFSSSTKLQLTATKRTRFQPVQASPERLTELFQPRASVSFGTLMTPGFRPLYGEVDVVGYVISIADEHGISPVIYLADEQLHLVAVRVSCSLLQLALEELVQSQALLALSNLQPRCQAPVPILYAGDLALVSAKPKEPQLQEASERLRNAVQGCEQFFKLAEEKLFSLIHSNASYLPPPNGRIPAPKTPTWNTRRQGMNSETGPTPQKSAQTVGSVTPVNRKTPPEGSSLVDRDPKSLKRKRGLDYLSHIPSPPPLQLLKTSMSPAVSKTFHPPRRSETPAPVSRQQQTPPACLIAKPVEGEWVSDEELAMINTQALLDGSGLQNQE